MHTELEQHTLSPLTSQNWIHCTSLNSDQRIGGAALLLTSMGFPINAYACRISPLGIGRTSTATAEERVSGMALHAFKQNLTRDQPTRVFTDCSVAVQQLTRYGSNAITARKHANHPNHHELCDIVGNNANLIWD
jgi:hypothetical protein